MLNRDVEKSMVKRVRRKRIGAVLAAGAVVVAAGAAAPAAGAAGPGMSPESEKLPVVHSGLAAMAHASAHPNTSPAGANDPSCEPSEEHPLPVVLVHGTVENMTVNWYSLSPRLANEGFCVFAFNYGQGSGLGVGLPGAYPTGGTTPVPRSAGELAEFVDEVRATTGSDEVDIVGHSQGGMMPRYYVKELGGAEKVNHLVGLSPSNHGTEVFGLVRLPGVSELLQAGMGDSVRDQTRGSEFLDELNSDGDTLPGVEYTVIQTRYDEIVTPYTSAFLHGPNVNNVLLQDGCEINTTDHVGIAFDRRAEQYVVNALDPANAEEPPCVPSPPIEADEHAA